MGCLLPHGVGEVLRPILYRVHVLVLKCAYVNVTFVSCVFMCEHVNPSCVCPVCMCAYVNVTFVSMWVSHVRVRHEFNINETPISEFCPRYS